MAKKKDYSELLIENMNSKFELILEAVGGMQENVKKIPEIADKVERLENDMSVVKLATKETNHDVKDIKVRVEKIDKQLDELEERITVLESV